MASGYALNGIDLDSIFAALGGATAGPNTGYKVNGVDLSQRYRPSTSTGDRISFNTGYRVNGVDLRSFFRVLGYTASISTTLTGSSSVSASNFSTGSWNYSASATSGLSRVRFYVTGHTAGAWTTLSGAPTSYSNSTAWSNPFGSPSISTTPGTYTFNFEAEDVDGNTSLSQKTVTVTT